MAPGCARGTGYLCGSGGCRHDHPPRRAIPWAADRAGRTDITEYAPNEKVSFKTASLFPVAATYAVEAAEAGTKLTAAFEAEISGIFRPAAPLLVRMARSRIEGQLTNLKNRLEAGA